MGSIEGLNAISTGQLVTLSEQELIDCDWNDSGCGGGFMETAFAWVVENGGITTAADYTFRGEKYACNKNKVTHHNVTIAGHMSLDIGEANLIRALVQQVTLGPLLAVREGMPL